jgi:gliding motility-associated-like protein
MLQFFNGSIFQINCNFKYRLFIALAICSFHFSYSQLTFKYGDSNSNYPTIIKSDGVASYILGQTEINGSSYGTITKISEATGNVIWQKRINFASQINDMEFVPPQGPLGKTSLYIIGHTLPFDANNSSFIMSMNSETAATECMDIFNQTGRESFRKIVRNVNSLNPNFQYYILGSRGFIGGAPTQDKVILINLRHGCTSGTNINFVKEYNFLNSQDIEFSRGLQVMSDGSMLLMGNETTNGNGMVIRINGAGDMRFAVVYNKEMEVLDAIEQQNGNILFSGNVITNGISSAVLFVTDGKLSILGRAAENKNILKYNSIESDNLDGLYLPCYYKSMQGNNNTSYPLIQKLSITGFINSPVFQLSWQQSLEKNSTTTIYQGVAMSIGSIGTISYTDGRNVSNTNFDFTFAKTNAQFDAPCADSIVTVLTPLDLGFQNVVVSNINSSLPSPISGNIVNANWVKNNFCEAPCLLDFTMMAVERECNDVFCNINITNGALPYTITWDFECDSSIDALGNQAQYSFSTIGTHQICINVVDGNGCVKYKTFSIVTIGDREPPTITCPENITLACNESTAPTNAGVATAIDNCQSNVSLSFTDIRSGNLCDSTIIRTWQAVDSSGNKSSCIQIITKRDQLAPVITCPLNGTVACNDSITPNKLGIASAKDNCQTNLNISYFDIVMGTACDSTIIRTWIANDGCGNTSSCVQTITKVDQIAPLINCPANISIACSDSISPNKTGMATATDNCQSNVFITFVDTIMGTSCDSIITRTWTATDSCGNASSCVQTITKVDQTAPMINCPADISIACSDSISPSKTGIATAIDDCQSNVFITFIDTIIGTSCDSIITRTWTATDSCGNASSCVQTITKVDQTAPVINCPANISIACSDSITPNKTGIATAIDDCQSNVFITFSDIRNGTSCDSIITRTWTATDSCGNASSCVQTITKVDQTAPMINCPANISIACSDSISPNKTGMATAIDDCQSNVFITFVDTIMGTSCDSIITRTWTATDSCGNVSSCVQTITKVDQTAPMINCPANISIACGDSISPSKTGVATAIDDCQSNIFITFVDTIMGTSCDSIITRTWTATDSCGNTSSCVQTITKVDQTAPMINCPANISIACSDSISPSRTGIATAIDDCQSNVFITFSDIRNGTSCDSIITRTWTATDSCGNTSSCVQTITKVDQTAPMINCPANVTIDCNAPITPSNTGFATGIDNCQSNLMITFVDVISGTFCDTIITRTWTATDSCGNQSACVQMIYKKENLDLMILCPADITIECNQSTDTLITGNASASSKCPGLVQLSFVDIKSGTVCDTTIKRTWTAMDSCGNTSSCVQTITKIDRVAPTINCPVNVTLDCDASTSPINTGTATASDNCQTNLTISFTDINTGTSCDSTITRTWIATDSCGNTSSCVQTITKMDQTAPLIICPSDARIQCNESISPNNLGFAIAMDNCQTNLQIIYIDTKMGNICDSTFLRTWTVTDSCSNTSSCVQTIIKVDELAPVINCPTDVTIDCDASILPNNTGSATAIDNCQANVYIGFTDIITGTACDSTITRTWEATDSCDNKSSCVQTITKVDQTAPVINCPPNITIDCNGSTSPSNTGTATATDNCQPNVSITFTDLKIGTICDTTINRLWIANDGCSNITDCEQIIKKSEIQHENCCDQTAFDTLLNKGFNLIFNGCEITISANQYSNCHFISSSPDFGDGTSNQLDTIAANGVWVHHYDTSGWYVICLNVIAFDENGRVCLKGKSCQSIYVDCAKTNRSCCQQIDFTENQNIKFKKSACDLCLSYLKKDSCDIISVDFGLGFNPWIENNICHTYSDTGTYHVCIKAERYDPFGNICFVKDSCFFVKLSCDENEFCTLAELKVPNGLTPNGDGINDDLIIQNTAECKSFDISIYNRWGQLVYTKAKYNGEWHGQSHSGEQLADGTYYLLLSLPKPSTEKRIFKTFIDLRTK